MKPHVTVIENWPQPDTVSSAVVVATGSKLIVGYGTGEDEFAVVSFPMSTNLKVGGPNDEALHGHPLYAFGLKHYSIHRIENSPWLHELERQNSVHSRHVAQWFLKDKVHYIFALKEETVECIVVEGEGSEVQVRVFESHQSALEHIRGSLDA